MKRAGTEMPARNSYSWVRASSPRWISAAEAVVPPMSKATRSASPMAAPEPLGADRARRRGPEEMKKTGFARATAAAREPAVGVADQERRRDARARAAASSSRAR